MQGTKYLIKIDQLKEILGKPDFHYDLDQIFEPVNAKQAKATENQKTLSEKQLPVLLDSSKTTTQVIENPTQVVQESSNILKKFSHCTI